MSKYYAGADWVKRSLRVENMSEIGEKVADLLGDLFAGIYHIDHKALVRVDWSNPHWIEVTVRSHGFSTWDFNLLTKLVVLCHDRCIRCEILPLSNWGYFKLNFHQRTRDGSIAHGHPTMEEAVAMIRERNGEG